MALNVNYRLTDGPLWGGNGTTKSKDTAVAKPKGSTTKKSTKTGTGTSKSTATATTPATLGANRVDSSLDTMALYNQYLKNQQDAARASYEASMARIGEAYNAGLGNINSAYDTSKNALSGNYDSQKNQLKGELNRSQKNIRQDAEGSLREAYINAMMNRKNMQQNMAAMGLSGGATESSLAKLYNNYGSSRNNIETTQNRNLGDLQATYDDNLASALQAYNNGMAQLENQRSSALNNLLQQKLSQEMAAEQALTNNQMSALGNISTDSSYLAALANLANANGNFQSTMDQFNPTATQNTLAADQINTQQATTGADSNYGMYLAQQALQQGNTQGAVTALYQAMKNGTDPNLILQFANANNLQLG